MRTYLRVCAVVIGLLGLGMILPPGLCQTPKSEPPKDATKTPTKTQLTVKVFKFERADPAAVIEAMNNLLESTDAVVAPTLPNVGLSNPMPPQTATIGFGIGGGGIGFTGGVGVGGGMQSTPVWRATVDDRTKALIVRGSPRHLQVAADLVALADRPANAPLPALKIVKAYPLKEANTAEMMAVIEALGFEEVRLSSLNEKLMVIIGPEETAKAIGDLVKELDVPAKQDKQDKQ